MLRGERRPSEPEPRAAGPHAAGAGDLVPAAQHRRAERGHAPAPADRGRARLRAAARHLRPGDRPAPPRAAVPPTEIRAAARGPPDPAGHHRPSHRGQAGHRAGEAPPDLPPAGGSGVAPLDPAGAPGADRRAPQRDRAALDDGRAPAGQAHRAAGSLLGAALLQRDAVRGGPRPAREARAGAAARLSRASGSRSPRSSSSAPGSAATGTAIRSSPTTSPGARCWRTGSPASGATAGGWASWSGRSASPSAPIPVLGPLPRRRSSGSWRRPAKARRSPPATRARSSASTSPACCRRLEVMIRGDRAGRHSRRLRPATPPPTR